MQKKTFGVLLTEYMYRIGMSESFLGNKIGVSSETVRKWKLEYTKPRKTNRDKVVAAAKLMRLKEEETNDLLEAVPFPKEFPVIEDLAEAIFINFIPSLFNRLDRLAYPIMLLLTQATWGEPPFRKALLVHAKNRYSPENVLHIQPPYNLDMDTYFADLGEQCGFDNVNSGNSLKKTFDKRIKNNRLFLLISRFENSEPSLREELAKMIRALSDVHTNRLHVMFCGGAGLSELKFKNCAMSLLNLAEVEHWPELGYLEVKALAKYRFQKLQLSDDLANELLYISGGHPQLLNECLKIRQAFPRFALDKYPELLSQRDYIWQLFTPFMQNIVEKKQIGEWLQQEHLGKMQPYILNDLIRQLYWKNLLVGKEMDGEKYLFWRCKAIKMAGLEILI